MVSLDALSDSQILEFEGFRLNPARRRLLRPDGAPVALRPRVYDLLAFLVAHPGEILDRRTLIDAVWPNLVVDENNLSQSVAALRRIFGDARETPRFILTAPGRGYQFVAPVRVVEAEGLHNGPRTLRSGGANTLGQATSPQRLRALAQLAAATAALVGGVWTIVRWAPPSAPAPAETTIAVLPFANISSDPEQEAFVDGLSEELMNRLGQVEGLRVTGRTSAFVYKNHTEDLREIGETLGVANILEGAVRTEGDRRRITVELVDAADGHQLWSSSYGRDFGGIFAVQDEIAREVTRALGVELGVGYTPVPVEQQTDDPVAYDLFLRARGLAQTGGPRNLARAEELLHEAIARDPDFAAAQTLLFRTLFTVAAFSPDRAEEIRAEQDAIITNAIANAPEAWMGHYLRAIRLIYRADLLGARRELDTAFESAPTGMRAGLEETLFQLRLVTGRWSDVLEPIRAHERADPLSLAASLDLQRALHGAGLVEEAEAEYLRSRDLQGDRSFVEGFAVMRALAEGLDDEVVAERRAYFLDARAPDRRSGLGVTLAVDVDLDDPEARAAALNALGDELARAPGPEAMSPLAIAWWADYLGDTDLALEALETDFQRFGLVQALPWDGVFKHIRSAPGFKDLMRAYGYEAYWRETGEWSDFCRPLGEDDFECR